MAREKQVVVHPILWSIAQALAKSLFGGEDYRYYLALFYHDNDTPHARRIYYCETRRGRFKEIYERRHSDQLVAEYYGEGAVPNHEEVDLGTVHAPVHHEEDDGGRCDRDQ